MHTFTKLLLVALFAATALAQACSPSCSTGLSCCASQCYNTSTAGCETGSSGQEVLCGFQHLPAQIHDAVCGSFCYDTLTYGCCNSTNTIYGLGTKAGEYCPTASPTPVGTACSSDSSCATGLSCCNTKCYNASTAGCEVSSTGLNVLCGFQHLPAEIHDGACGTTCYDLLYYGCCNATSTIYDLTNPTACASSPTAGPTASPTAAPTSNCGSAPCGTGLDCCGAACYNSASYSCCNATSVLVQVGQEALCAGTSNLLACGNAQCLSGYGCCASGCYDMTTRTCVVNSNNQQMLCNSGDQSCGLYCYSPSTATCCNNQIYGIGDVSLPASCGGPATGNFDATYNGYNGNGGYYYDSNGQFQSCNSASAMLMSGFAVVLAVLAAML